MLQTIKMCVFVCESTKGHLWNHGDETFIEEHSEGIPPLTLCQSTRKNISAGTRTSCQSDLLLIHLEI